MTPTLADPGSAPLIAAAIAEQRRLAARIAVHRAELDGLTGRYAAIGALLAAYGEPVLNPADAPAESLPGLLTKETPAPITPQVGAEPPSQIDLQGGSAAFEEAGARGIAAEVEKPLTAPPSGFTEVISEMPEKPDEAAPEPVSEPPPPETQPEEGTGPGLMPETPEPAEPDPTSEPAAAPVVEEPPPEPAQPTITITPRRATPPSKPEDTNATPHQAKSWKTPARDEALRRYYPDPKWTLSAIIVELNSLPGPYVSNLSAVYTRANELGLRRSLLPPPAAPSAPSAPPAPPARQSGFNMTKTVAVTPPPPPRATTAAPPLQHTPGPQEPIAVRATDVRAWAESVGLRGVPLKVINAARRDRGLAAYLPPTDAPLYETWTNDATSAPETLDLEAALEWGRRNNVVLIGDQRHDLLAINDKRRELGLPRYQIMVDDKPRDPLPKADLEIPADEARRRPEHDARATA